MVVVPTSKHVRLTYGTTPAEWLGRVRNPRGPRGPGRSRCGGARSTPPDARPRKIPAPIGGAAGYDFLPLRDGEDPRLPVADAALDSIFKAYDIRGIYPDEIDESVARAIGERVRRLHRRGPGARRARRPPLVGAPGRGLHRGRDHRRRRRRRPRDRLHRPLLLRGRATSTPRRDVHREPQPRASTTASSSAGPAPRRSARTPGSRRSRRWWPEGLLERAEDPGRVERLDLLAAVRRPRALVRRRRRARAAAWSSPTPPTAWAGSSCPRCSPVCPSSSPSSTGSSTAPSRTTRPT